jgi:hypothetical protein
MTNDAREGDKLINDMLHSGLSDALDKIHGEPRKISKQERKARKRADAYARAMIAQAPPRTYPPVITTADVEIIAPRTMIVDHLGLFA